MVVSNGADHMKYQQLLRDSESILAQLVHPRPKIIWLNQFPTFDFWAENGLNAVDIYAEKIHRYNLILRRVFRLDYSISTQTQQI